MAKGKLRHIAISVPNKEEAAKFYEDTFGFARVSQSRVAMRLSDRVHRVRYLDSRVEGREQVGEN